MAEDRPPYVRFSIQTIEDRNATLEAGHYVGKDVVFAHVTPIGSRDELVKVADDWIDTLKEAVKQERFPQAWLNAYAQALADYRAGRETPVDGTPINNWPGLSPSQCKTLLDIHVRTVEDLAVANEETIGRIGMGGQALKQKAIAYLDASKKHGKTTEELNNLRVETKEQKQHIEDLEKRLKEVTAQVDALMKLKEEA